MRHAIIQNGTPVIYRGRFAVDDDGIQHPLRGMTRSEKLVHSYYEIEQDLTVPVGHVLTGVELIIGDGVVIEQATYERMSDEQLTAAIKAEAHKRINNLVPEWKQRNLTAQASILAEKGRSNWTAQEMAAWEAGEAIWAQVEAIRAASDAIEAMTPIPTDFVDDQYWP
jgi:hypothetical protein